MSSTAVSQGLLLRSGAWYGDSQVELALPAGWEIAVHNPRTPPPLSSQEIAKRLERPTGALPLRELARGRTRPLILVDDLTRPTPAAVVLPVMLRHLQDAGIEPRRVQILLAQGAHGAVAPDAMLKKVGAEAAGACRLLVHDHLAQDLVRVGRTSRGTPVLVNRQVAESDLVLGVGGVYPHHTVGFGGGSKLALGALGRRSIVHLHYGRPTREGSYDTDNEFRRDLDEIARLVRLESLVALHVDANREIVRLDSGDPEALHPAAVEFCRQAYRAPLPGDADLVISNAYPMDVSLTFMRSKGLEPLYHAAAGASRVVMAACPEGVGLHQLFPFLNGPRFGRQRHLARRLSVLGPRRIAGNVGGRLRRAAQSGHEGPAPGTEPAHPTHLYSPLKPEEALPGEVPLWEGGGELMRQHRDWSDLVAAVQAEQGGANALRVAVYPCAPLQVLG